MSIIAKFLSVVLLLFPAVSQAESEFRLSTIEIKTKTESHFFTVEVAETLEEQAQGLMYRTKLDDDKGMLFLFKENPTAAMWMKNTLIALDMVFIDKDGKIIYIAENTKPESTDIISAYAPTAAVVELAGGITKKLDITAGDEVKHPYFEQ